MTAKAALCEQLLNGKVINIKNCFTLIGLTNAPREISRMIEQPFTVIVTRTPRNGKSRYGQSVTWIDYHLSITEHNKDGIEKMKEYLKAQKVDAPSPSSGINVVAHTRKVNKPVTNQPPLF